MNTLLKLKVGNEIVPVGQSSILESVWFWISITELLIMLFLFYKLKSKSNNSQLSDFEKSNIKNSKKNEIDMDNLMNSIHNSRTLYKELTKKCHPDRFINNPVQKKSEEIFQEITKNERNYEKLNSLKLRAENELNIKF
jgi:hypothetical protein